MTDEWGFETEKPSDITLKELAGLCIKMRDLRTDKKVLDDQIKEINSELKKVETKILENLDEYGMKNFSGDWGTVSRTRRYSVKQPGTPAEKGKFFDYLRDQGVFEDLVSVNSRTLCSFVKQEIESKKEDGIDDFVPPGLNSPEIIETITLRKK